MSRSRSITLALFALSMLAVAAPSEALCVKCIVNECWSNSTATAANCYSYGTSCLTSGKCAGGGSECDPCAPDEDAYLALPTPLASEFILVEVKIERPKTGAARVAVTKSDGATRQQ